MSEAPPGLPPAPAGAATVLPPPSRVMRGIRWALWLNVATLPMSFVTSLILGRSSPQALGTYGAIQLFIGSFQTFFVFGGNAVFTRIVPGLPRERRAGFLASYIAVVLGLFLAVAAIALAIAPSWVARLLARFGSPSIATALVVASCVVVWAFCSHFLYAVQEAPRAGIALKLVIAGYFVLAVLTLLPGARAWLNEPSR